MNRLRVGGALLLAFVLCGNIPVASRLMKPPPGVPFDQSHIPAFERTSRQTFLFAGFPAGLLAHAAGARYTILSGHCLLFLGVTLLTMVQPPVVVRPSTEPAGPDGPVMPPNLEAYTSHLADVDLELLRNRRSHAETDPPPSILEPLNEIELNVERGVMAEWPRGMAREYSKAAGFIGELTPLRSSEALAFRSQLQQALHQNVVEAAVDLHRQQMGNETMVDLAVMLASDSRRAAQMDKMRRDLQTTEQALRVHFAVIRSLAAAHEPPDLADERFRSLDARAADLALEAVYGLSREDFFNAKALVKAVVESRRKHAQLRELLPSSAFRQWLSKVDLITPHEKQLLLRHIRDVTSREGHPPYDVEPSTGKELDIREFGTIQTRHKSSRAREDDEAEPTQPTRHDDYRDATKARGIGIYYDLLNRIAERKRPWVDDAITELVSRLRSESLNPHEVRQTKRVLDALRRAPKDASVVEVLDENSGQIPTFALPLKIEEAQAVLEASGRPDKGFWEPGDIEDTWNGETPNGEAEGSPPADLERVPDDYEVQPRRKSDGDTHRKLRRERFGEVHFFDNLSSFQESGEPELQHFDATPVAKIPYRVKLPTTSQPTRISGRDQGPRADMNHMSAAVKLVEDHMEAVQHADAGVDEVVNQISSLDTNSVEQLSRVDNLDQKLQKMISAPQDIPDEDRRILEGLLQQYSQQLTGELGDMTDFRRRRRTRADIGVVGVDPGMSKAEVRDRVFRPSKEFDPVSEEGENRRVEELPEERLGYEERREREMHSEYLQDKQVEELLTEIDTLNPKFESRAGNQDLDEIWHQFRRNTDREDRENEMRATSDLHDNLAAVIGTDAFSFDSVPRPEFPLPPVNESGPWKSKTAPTVATPTPAVRYRDQTSSRAPSVSKPRLHESPPALEDQWGEGPLATARKRLADVQRQRTVPLLEKWAMPEAARLLMPPAKPSNGHTEPVFDRFATSRVPYPDPYQPAEGGPPRMVFPTPTPEVEPESDDFSLLRYANVAISIGAAFVEMGTINAAALFWEAPGMVIPLLYAARHVNSHLWTCVIDRSTQENVRVFSYILLLVGAVLVATHAPASNFNQHVANDRLEGVRPKYSGLVTRSGLTFAVKPPTVLSQLLSQNFALLMLFAVVCVWSAHEILGAVPRLVRLFYLAKSRELLQLFDVVQTWKVAFLVPIAAATVRPPWFLMSAMCALQVAVCLCLLLGNEIFVQSVIVVLLSILSHSMVVLDFIIVSVFTFANHTLIRGLTLAFIGLLYPFWIWIDFQNPTSTAVVVCLGVSLLASFLALFLRPYDEIVYDPNWDVIVDMPPPVDSGVFTAQETRV
ncbi:MAG: hypothetical protein KVP17_003206 [Porospora cf. gigantea B]|uniref:uncharacterized protein n=1 Tax=Porospora cf. gigantea B TaxID=2853592 RepID=UPI0035719B5B|nr:MAG: hypothetical protein KVP17_003206 [Porospora cf. gigantea B]